MKKDLEREVEAEPAFTAPYTRPSVCEGGVIVGLNV